MPSGGTDPPARRGDGPFEPVHPREGGTCRIPANSPTGAHPGEDPRIVACRDLVGSWSQVDEKRAALGHKVAGFVKCLVLATKGHGLRAGGGGGWGGEREPAPAVGGAPACAPPLRGRRVRLCAVRPHSPVPVTRGRSRHPGFGRGRPNG